METATVQTDSRRWLWRSRWAAIGAAVAVTLGGGGLFVANAASSPPSSVVTIDPVRILDTRTDVGLAGPFVSGVSQKLQVTGVAVPAGATGVLLNVTVVAPSAAGFLSVRPGDATGAPSTSSLNFTAGDIVPNSVQVGLPTTGAHAGKVDITYDAFGQAGPTTEVLIDAVAYLVAGGGGTPGPAGPQGPAGAQGVAGATGPAVPTDPAVLVRLTALEMSRPFAKFDRELDSVLLSTTPASVLAVQVVAPVAGNVTINYSTYVFNPEAGGDLRCAPFRSGEVLPSNISPLARGVGFFESAATPNGDEGSVSGTTQFPISAGQTITYSLACEKSGNSLAAVGGREITAIFTPAP